MRPIDADALKDHVGIYDGTNAQVEAVEVKYIDDAPTIEPDIVKIYRNIRALEESNKRPTGHWVMIRRTYNENKSYTGIDENGEEHTVFVHKVYKCDEPYCSECGKQAGDVSQNFCCYCGVKMIGGRA